jgi:hypothetical protein
MKSQEYGLYNLLQNSNFIIIQLPKFLIRFCPIGFFNGADTLESSSILIYSKLLTGLFTDLGWREAALIIWLLNTRVNESGLKVRMGEEGKAWKLIAKQKDHTLRHS